MSNLSIEIPESELHFDFIRSSGPGGQNVNKVATAVQLRFFVDQSSSLTSEQKKRLKSLAGSRMTDEGCLVIEAKRYRTQEKNKEDALARLRSMVTKATEIQLPRTATRPTRASVIRRIDAKKHKSSVKKFRRGVNTDLE